MSGWIRIQRDLLTDPRMLRIGLTLGKTATSGFQPPANVALALGALAQIWMLADTHIGDDDTLPLGADEINQIVGIEGFCELLPQDWLQIIDPHHVKLPGYHTHNGTAAKQKALLNKRVAKHRNNGNGKALHPTTSAVTVKRYKSNGLALHPKPPGEPFNENDIPGLDIPSWRRWREYRLTRKPIKTPSLASAARSLAKFGDAQPIVVENSIAQGYQGLFEPKANGSAGKPATAAPKPLNLAEWADCKRQAAAIGFRDPLAGESVGAYRTEIMLAQRPAPQKGDRQLDLSGLLSKVRTP